MKLQLEHLVLIPGSIMYSKILEMPDLAPDVKFLIKNYSRRHHQVKIGFQYLDLHKTRGKPVASTLRINLGYTEASDVMELAPTVYFWAFIFWLQS